MLQQHIYVHHLQCLQQASNPLSDTVSKYGNGSLAMQLGRLAPCSNDNIPIAAARDVYKYHLALHNCATILQHRPTTVWRVNSAS